MGPNDFKRLREALLTARGLEGPEREAFLVDFCGKDQKLRRELDSLLEHDPSPVDIVQTGALAAGLGAEMSPVLDQIRNVGLPERIGAYRILNTLGEGGMGVVYLAQQEEPIRRQVALKLLKRGMDNPRVIARFESEVQALAAMEHPYIARVYDAGTETGPASSDRAYFVMELVRGIPITEYCDQHRLTSQQRLRLFLRVCAGVTHAHQKGIIHRDLKPSNILVIEESGDHLPKIIDFGIAKAVGGNIDGEVTLDGQLMGTPNYMSPEQADGQAERVDTRSDVYSLGVILYELLAGQRPYQFETSSLREIRDRLQNTQADKPSTAITRPSARLESEGDEPTPSGTTRDPGAVARARRTTPAQLRRSLRGDLDNIVLMAMRSEPDRRYGSVERLAQDIERHLDGLPVAARGDGWSYRASKFAKRHRIAVGAAAALLVFLIGFAATVSVQSARLARERDRALVAEESARTEARTAEEALDFLVGFFESSNPHRTGGEHLMVRDVLDTGVQQVRGDLDEHPAVQARLLATLGLVYHSLGNYDVADTLLRDALTAHEASGEGDNLQLASTYNTLATLTHDQGNLEASVDYSHQALRILRSHYGDEHTEVAYNLNNLAVTLQAQGKLEEAEPYYREALAMNRRLLGDQDPEVAWGLNTLGWVLHSMARYEDAEACYTEALRVQRAHLTPNHPDLGATLNNLGGLYYHLGDYDQAESIWGEALRLYETVYDQDHAAVARAKRNYARVFRDRGEAEVAEKLVLEAMEINERVLGMSHPFTGILYTVYAELLLDAEDVEEAQRYFDRAMGVLTQSYPDDHPRVITTQSGLARLHLARGEAEAASRVYRTILEAHRSRLPDGHPDIGEMLVMLGLSESGRSDSAMATAQKGVKTLEGALPEDHWKIAYGNSVVGTCLVAAGQREAGLGLLRASHDELTTALSSNSPYARNAEQRLRQVE